jgi:hypothetical protein
MKIKHRFIPFKLLNVVVVLLRLVVWCPAAEMEHKKVKT